MVVQKLSVIDKAIMDMMANGSKIKDITEKTQKSKRYILYRLSNLKIDFDCKTTTQLMHQLTRSGVLD